MRWVLPLIAVGCGRIGFRASPDGGPIGHDEDGDGVPDLVDDCPHIPGPQADRDGDGVGDACDPEPDNPRQHRVMFAAMTADDQPFAESAGAQMQLADALHLEVTGGDEILDAAVSYGSVQITVGTRVEQVLGTNVQHQLALAPTPTSGFGIYTFVEFNEGVGYSNAQITHYDGMTFTAVTAAPLPNGFHSGPLQLQLTAVVGGTLELDGGWPGEPYQLSIPGPWPGGSAIAIDINHLVVDFDYVFVVSW